MSEEQILFRGSPSVVTRFGALFIGFLVLAGGVTGYFLTLQPYNWILAGLAALALLYMISVVVQVKATRYELTTERLRISKGIFTRRTEEVELYRALDTSLVEPLTLRMLGLGTIEIRTADANQPKVWLEAIHGARSVREDLRRHIEECRDRKRVRMTEFDNGAPGEAGEGS